MRTFFTAVFTLMVVAGCGKAEQSTEIQQEHNRNATANNQESGAARVYSQIKTDRLLPLSSNSSADNQSASATKDDTAAARVYGQIKTDRLKPLKN